MSQELNEEQRNAYIAEAWQIARDNIAFIPLHNQVIVWATREGFTQPIVANNTPQFYMGAFTD